MTLYPFCAPCDRRYPVYAELIAEASEQARLRILRAGCGLSSRRRDISRGGRRSFRKYWKGKDEARRSLIAVLAPVASFSNFSNRASTAAMLALDLRRNVRLASLL
jgi:hypothetical protein